MSKPEIYVGQSVIAVWLGVTRAAVSNWITARHITTIPVPDVVVASNKGDEVLGWSPDRRDEWVAWHRDHNPRPRRARYVTTEDMEDWR
jgi:hypothetical protein